MAHRYFVDPLPPPGWQTLPRDTSHHLARVVRVRAGDEVVLFDGRGGEAVARVAAVNGAAVDAQVGPAEQVDAAAAVAVELAFALPKGTRAEWIFEHATEVGATALRPVRTARSGDRGARPRGDRWQRVVQAAAGQCGRAWLPEVFAPEQLAALLGRDDLPAERYVGCPGAPPLGAARTERALWRVGPPGGLTAGEQKAARDAGFEPRGLGPMTLRTETAVLAGAVLLLAGR